MLWASCEYRRRMCTQCAFPQQGPTRITAHWEWMQPHVRLCSMDQLLGSKLHSVAVSNSITLTFYLVSLTRKSLLNCKVAFWWFWSTILMWLAGVCSYLQGKREATGQHHGRQEDACWDFLMEVLHWECDAEASEIMSHYHHLHTIHGTTSSAIQRFLESSNLLRSSEHKLHRGCVTRVILRI